MEQEESQKAGIQAGISREVRRSEGVIQSATASDKITMDVVEIQKWIPHRYPFLLIDRVTDLVPGESISAIKCVTINEGFFQGHFPGNPVMPGVLIIEAMAQAAAVLARYSEVEASRGKIFYLVGVDNFKWKRPVFPGDTIDITMRTVRRRNPLWIMEGSVAVDGKVLVTGNISAAAA
jgi:3-hydroxyacyl-[acyl-carrier-protein] dehydratase